MGLYCWQFRLIFYHPPFLIFLYNQSTNGRYILCLEIIEDLRMNIEDLRSAFGGFYFKKNGAKRHP